jgi:peptidoglycan hydrolase-like protein with peptidoglycan-binding domain
LPVTGKSIALTRENIRYCLFQEVRVEALGPLTAAVDLAIFNALVNDWNARCALALYPPADKVAVDAELLERRAAIETEGREFASKWRRRMAVRIGTSSAGASVARVSAAAAGNGAQPPFGEMPPEMSTPPAVVTAQLFLNDAAALAPSRPPSLMLLHTYVAARVQRRLNELGYTIMPMDGTWGPMSRMALRRFKQANGLLWDDALDAETAARLFSMAAVSSPPVDAAQSENGALTFEAVYPPPAGATMNPLNRTDASTIQRRLAALGYGVGDVGVWGAASRATLREFKATNHLPNDDEWDAATEAALNSEGPASVAGSFVARWPKRPIVCDSGSAAGNDLMPKTALQSEDSRATGDPKSSCRAAAIMTDPSGAASARALPTSTGAAPAAGNGGVGGRPAEIAPGSRNAGPRVAPRPLLPTPAPKSSAPSPSQ